MRLDIIIPCYNAAQTLSRALTSCLTQAEVRRVIVVDDGSQDETWQLMQQWAKQDTRIFPLRLAQNSGAAMARNWGVLHSDAEAIAFLDADDEYQHGALSAAIYSLQHIHYVGLIRLRMQAIGLPSHYQNHPNFAQAWQTVMMTGAGNTVFRRAFFLACGGFPCHEIFRQFGGEDGALGLATVGSSVVGTLFDAQEPAVLHHWRTDIHAQHLLDAILFGKNTRQIAPENIAQANAVTEAIQSQLHDLKTVLNFPQSGVMPITVYDA